MNKSQLFKEAHKLAKTLFEGAYAVRFSAALKMVYASLKKAACSAVKEVKELVGTEKQVKWANDIKSKFLATIEKLDVETLNNVLKEEFETRAKAAGFAVYFLCGHIVELKDRKSETYKSFEEAIESDDPKLTKLFEEFRNELSVIDFANNVEDAAFFIENRDDAGFQTAYALVIYNLAKKLGFSPRTNEKNFNCFAYEFHTDCYLMEGKYLEAVEK